MQAEKLNQFKQTLQQMRRRITGELEHIVTAIQDDVNPAGNNSAAPVHLADAATGSIDADVHVLETERHALADIEDALNRIADGSFGLCADCGGKISEQRLQAIPYTPLCIQCAKADDKPPGRTGAHQHTED